MDECWFMVQHKTGVAQLVERKAFNFVVRGSIPLTGNKTALEWRYNKYFPQTYKIAFLVRFRSIILVVRIRVL